MKHHDLGEVQVLEYEDGTEHKFKAWFRLSEDENGQPTPQAPIGYGRTLEGAETNLRRKYVRKVHGIYTYR